MRTKRSPLDVEPLCFSRDFDIVVQQLQTGLMLYPKPYDSCPTEVWKGPDPTELHGEWAVPAGNGVYHGVYPRSPRLAHFTKELECEMPLLRRNPRELGNLRANRRE